MVERKRQTPELTREKILDTAFVCFAEKGFAGCSIGDIAEAAGFPKSLLLYHFDSKEQLWQAAITRKAAPLIELLERYLGDRSPSLDLEGMVRGRFRFLQENPLAPRILTWISLDPETLTPDLMRTFGPRVAQKVMQDLSPSGDSTVLAAMIIGAMDGWFRYRGLYTQLGLIANPEEADEAMVEGLAQLCQVDTVSQR